MPSIQIGNCGVSHVYVSCVSPSTVLFLLHDLHLILSALYWSDGILLFLALRLLRLLAIETAQYAEEKFLELQLPGSSGQGAPFVHKQIAYRPASTAMLSGVQDKMSANVLEFVHIGEIFAVIYQLSHRDTWKGLCVCFDGFQSSPLGDELVGTSYC